MLSTTAHAQNKPSFLQDDVEYLWPTDASYYMSSSFAETRSAHFHAALDIGTWGRTGYRIYATRDGIVHRVGVSPGGYGNVVYLKHDDGSYSVYAHLQDFMPEIRSVVDSTRFARNYSSTFDEVLESYNIRVKQGDLIAYSGESGIGPPHLHFELRTPQGRPFNPLLTNLSVPDKIPPRFVSLSVEPLSADALIDGKKDILQKRVTRSGGTNHFGTIPVIGSIGLGVDVFDQADGVNNVYAVYDLELKVNGMPYFHSRVDSFSYDNSHQMFLDRVYPILRESRRGFQRLFVDESNRLPFYSETDHFGALNLPVGRHHFEIIAKDYFGNTSRADGYLQVIEPDALASNEVLLNDNLPILFANASSSQGLSDWHWNNNWVSPRNFNDELNVSMSTLGSSFSLINNITLNQPASAIDLPGDHSAIITINEAPSHILHRIHPGKKSSIYSVDQRASVSFLPRSVYHTMSVGLNYTIDSSGLPEIRIYPEHQPINEKAQVNFVLDKEQAQKDNLGFYYRNPRDNSFKMVDSKKDGAVITGEVGHFDTYYILEDTLAPEISNPRIYQRRDGKWELSVALEDDLSGIDYHASEFYWNGVRGIAEYDPDNDRLCYHHPEFKPESQNKIRVIVADRVGNVTYRNFDVRN